MRYLSTFLLSIMVLLTISSCTMNPKVVYSPEDITVESKKLDQFFQADIEKYIARSPTFSTYLGRKDRYHELDDISYKRAQEDIALNKESLKQLRSFNFNSLSEKHKVSYKLYEERLQNGIDDFKYFHNRFFVSQMFGHHSDLPNFMINMHQIKTETDAQAYISRLNGFKKSFKQLDENMKTQEQKGVRMPQFVFAKVIRDSQNIISGYPFTKSKKEQSPIYKDFANKIQAAKISIPQQKKLLAALTESLNKSVGPAYTNFISYMQELEKRSQQVAGAWSLPDGKNFYNNRLQRITSTKMSAMEIHKLGLQEVSRIQGEMRSIMQRVNFNGNLQDFFTYIKTNPKFQYPNTQAGKDAYLKDTRAIIENMEKKLPKVFNVLPKANVQVRPVEPFREKSAGIAFYQGPALDGSRPGIYYVNLSDMSSVAKYDMEALAYHEALPGHHMQIAIAQQLKDLPLFRRLGGYTSYSEGWGLYSEYLPKEMGLYQDPYSDFGRLSMEIWRACRLVVDTGIHYYKWTRDQSIDYLKANTPSSDDEIMKGVERYFVMPGQATAYKIGQLKILSLREMAKKKLGSQFDIKTFHDHVLKNGAVPLNVLESNIKDYIKESKSL